MKTCPLLILNFLLLLISPALLFAQTGDAAQKQPLQNALAFYENAIGEESHLYTGPQYVNYDKYYLKGHQFFRTDEDALGKVNYDGAWYDQVPMRYDIVLDKIILDHPTSAFQFSLVNEKVKNFNLLDHTFIRIVADSLSESPLKTGFYDLLFDGHLRLLAKRTKNIQEQATREGMTGEFDAVNKYYIQKENKYYPVKTKKSVYKVLPDKKKELQRYARDQKLNFRNNREKAILELVRFYDQPNA